MPLIGGMGMVAQALAAWWWFKVSSYDQEMRYRTSPFMGSRLNWLSCLLLSSLMSFDPFSNICKPAVCQAA
jgi:hypothetical protein